MKTSIYLVLIVILLTTSCSKSEKEITPKRVIIAGKVINPDPLENIISFNVNRIGVGSEKISPRLNKDGGFKIIFESYIPLDVLLKYKASFSVLTHPGDSIYLELDGSKEDIIDILKTVKYSGDASKVNNDASKFKYLYYSSNIYKNHEKNRFAIQNYNEVNYKLFRDSIKHKEQNLLNYFIIQENPSKETIMWAKTFLEVKYYKDMIVYPFYHRMANYSQMKDWNVPLPYYDFMKNHFKISDSILINSSSLSSFVNMYPAYLMERIRNDNKHFFDSPGYFRNHPGKMDSLRFFGTLKYINDPLLKQMVLSEILTQELESSITKMFKKYKSEISEIITEPYLRDPLFDHYNQTIQNIKNPEQASDAILSKLNESSIEDNVKNIIANNKRKVIYMDCWATWCGSCIAEFPSSKRLMNNYKAEKVAFVFVCLDSEEKNWKTILSKYSLGGQHYFLTKDQSSEFRNVFNITGVPHYILFDSEGNISEKRTFRPDGMKDKIDKLLTEK